MQQTGTLKKRRRRNLAKVNGLSTVPYDESLDIFTGQDIYGALPSSGRVKPFKASTSQDIRLAFSSKEMLQHRREAEENFNGRTRVTRDPNYHLWDDEGIFEEADYADITHGRAAASKDFKGLGPFSKRLNVPDSIKHRTHFLDVHTIHRIRELIWLGASCGALPWKWDGKNCRVEEWSPSLLKLWKLQWYFVSLQTCGLSLFQVYALHNYLTGPNVTYRDAFAHSFSLLWYVWAVYFLVNMHVYKDYIRQYINTMFQFNRKYTEAYLIHLDGYRDSGRVITRISTHTNMSQVLVSVILFMMMPNRPCYIYSYIHPKPWYWLIPFAIQQYLVCGQVITSYMLLSLVTVAHTNTSSFWLREIHNNNDSDYTTDDLRTPRAAIETYKALQILTQCFSDCMSPMAIPQVKIHMLTAIVPCSFILLRSVNRKFIEEFPGILSYPIGCLNITTVGFVILSMAAEVFDLGCSFIDSWSRTKQKNFRRILMSCPTLKVWVGRFYYITAATTITFFKTMFGFVTDCLITFP